MLSRRISTLSVDSSGFIEKIMNNRVYINIIKKTISPKVRKN